MKRSFRQLETQQHAFDYAQRLNTEWPERAEICQHIAEHVANAAHRLHEAEPRVLELCCGPGVLAEHLLTALPTVRYVGIDLSPTLLAFTRKRLESYAERATLIRANLNADGWHNELAQQDIYPFCAIVTMQSLHDLGGETEVGRIYGLARTLLVPGGLFLNADLIVQPGEELPNNPGRRSIERHLELLAYYGYTNITNSLTLGGFGCVVGTCPS